jgi:hypothetical protein
MTDSREPAKRKDPADPINQPAGEPEDTKREQQHRLRGRGCAQHRPHPRRYPRRLMASPPACVTPGVTIGSERSMSSRRKCGLARRSVATLSWPSSQGTIFYYRERARSSTDDVVQRNADPKAIAPATNAPTILKAAAVSTGCPRLRRTCSPPSQNVHNVSPSRLHFVEQGLKLDSVPNPPRGRVRSRRQTEQTFHACFSRRQPVFTISSRPASCSRRCRRPSAVNRYGRRRSSDSTERIQPLSSKRVIAPYRVPGPSRTPAKS